MQKIQKQKKLFIDSVKITEICFQKKQYNLLQPIFQCQYENY